jgi:hypothetical protein
MIMTVLISLVHSDLRINEVLSRDGEQLAHGRVLDPAPRVKGVRQLVAAWPWGSRVLIEVRQMLAAITSSTSSNGARP